ncbi:hypothetical protein [Deinococcus humi]|uniref:Uncharacterized protein n=1 Tax=Deinococcus humi TaxID=662880 RepID=A0A7W8JR82_9DEIO|nr:hypothetical protein [Deinococcus humi]MBB5361373.1 hypothetical protein [Deinococcus humi]GGO19741.1 hypothetical protein GCM10008949_04350 [Deinococcus humi]
MAAVLRARRWELEAEWERLVLGYGPTDWPAARLINRRIRNIKRQLREKA